MIVKSESKCLLDRMLPDFCQLLIATRRSLPEQAKERISRIRGRGADGAMRKELREEETAYMYPERGHM
jgi:hypothetical protein